MRILETGKCLVNASLTAFTKLLVFKKGALFYTCFTQGEQHGYIKSFHVTS